MSRDLIQPISKLVGVVLRQMADCTAFMEELGIKGIFTDG